MDRKRELIRMNPSACRIEPFIRTGRTLLPLLLVVLSWCFTSGCASGGWLSRGRWVADYDRAQHQAANEDRDLLIIYTDDRHKEGDMLRSTLSGETFQSLTDDLVRCALVRGFEPDRRFVAQFKVERTPALIVARTDGTYHAHTDGMNEADLLAFFEEARFPGTPIARNPFVPSRSIYHWQASYDIAREHASDQDAALLVVYYRRLTRDWARLDDLLEQPEVYRRLGGMVACREGPLSPFAKHYVTRFGTLKLPAIVIAQPDGSHQVLEAPTSAASLVRFADQCRVPLLLSSGD